MADEPTPKPRTSSLKAGERIARLKIARKAERDRAAALERELNDLKAKPSADDLARKVKEYQDKERTDKHRKSFDEAAKGKVKPEALDDLWKLLSLDTSADEPDAAAIAAAIAENTKSRPYMVGDGSSTPAPTPLNPGPGSERGERAQSGGMTVKFSEIADGAWMRANQDRLVEAQTKGLVTYVD